MPLALTSSRSCLWALISRFFRKGHHRPDLQLTEIAFEDAVAMEIDFAATGSLEESVALVGEEPGDAPARSRLVGLHVTPLAPRVVLQAASGGFERVVDRLSQVPVRRFQFQMLQRLFLRTLLDCAVQARLLSNLA